ncbi:MAG: ACP phosphodiesterase [Flavobacteriaceae bacterium]
MNYLAHLALAYPNEGLVVGNFIGDHIRNKDLPNFSASIQQGVEMHRSIDVFTDNHSISKKLRALLFEKHRHVARVLLDVFYDHFLATHFSKFHSFTLEGFVSIVQPVLQNNFDILPSSAQHYLKGMITQDWLTKYETTQGIDFILIKMTKRTGIDSIREGSKSLIEYYEVLEQGFLDFYPDLVDAGNDFKISATKSNT